MNKNHILWGSQTTTAYGGVLVESKGYGVDLVASGLEGEVNIMATSQVQVVSGLGMITVTGTDAGATICLTAGEVGQIRQIVGVPDAGASIQMEPELITISVGPLAGGASITMTPESIIFKVAENTLSITPEGITETVTDTIRSATPAGHVLEAADGSFEVTPAAISLEAPTIEVTGDAMITMEGALVNIN
ncbi:hypothetical protein LOC68_15890 [Blastopirellula sp. JC732]|uniref:Uncharacterized protein n=1 Tax=Blastopirellula sediminis TaxID=2894196 RepID=A0A9X1MPY7_9BACT|nr:hypothetical protein [Blastopirellula sediminis]MCC9606832.1 hypothetical protein [Blastopirellula sediminis]MCC9629872.1 hypothetical protein [Blastopirellula sediminis]